MKTEDQFNFKIRSLNLLQYQCKECTRQLIRNHYQKNKNYYLEKTQRRNLELKSIMHNFVKEYLLNNPCVDCAESDITVLEFDHSKNKGIKFKAVSSLMKSRYPLEKVKEEIKKCEVRCANCHRRKTAVEFKWFKNEKPL
ncbi:MAG: hypothetical protein NTU81_02075 [Candidatus Nomurabacteria bacterium]|nr:hypothetical protein [Candidatus Nomurabacteria bacterium]